MCYNCRPSTEYIFYTVAEHSGSAKIRHDNFSERLGRQEPSEKKCRCVFLTYHYSEKKGAITRMIFALGIFMCVIYMRERETYRAQIIGDFIIGYPIFLMYNLQIKIDEDKSKLL